MFGRVLVSPSPFITGLSETTAASFAEPSFDA